MKNYLIRNFKLEKLIETMRPNEFNWNGMLGRCKTHYEKIMERRKEVDDKIYLPSNFSDRLNQFLLIRSEYDALGWGIHDRDSLYLSYSFPKGTQFSWRSSNIEEIKTFTHPDDIITLNDFDDIALIIYYVRQVYRWEVGHFDDAPININELHKRFGKNIPDNLFGFERFEKSMYFNDGPNKTLCVGYKSGYFFIIDFLYRI